MIIKLQNYTITLTFLNLNHFQFVIINFVYFRIFMF
jgi:hypothetical protein